MNEYNYSLLIRRLSNWLEAALRITASLNLAMSNSFDFEGSFWLTFKFVRVVSNTEYFCNVTWEPRLHL